MRQLANCQFKELETEILQQFVANIDDVETRCVTAEKAVEIATTLEYLEANLKDLHAPNGERSIAWEHIAQQESEKRP